MSFLIGGKPILPDKLTPAQVKMQRAKLKLSIMARTFSTARTPSPALEPGPEPEPEPEPGLAPFTPRAHEPILQFLPKALAAELRAFGNQAYTLAHRA
jgi:hypothetical protein